MENNHDLDFNQRLREQTKKLAFDIIMLYPMLRNKEELRVIGKQLLRSGTSIAANFRAVCRARSDAEHDSKLCIGVEESDETLFWLEMIEMTGYLKSEKLAELIIETRKVLIIFAKSRKALKLKHAGNGGKTNPNPSIQD